MREVGQGGIKTKEREKLANIGKSKASEEKKEKVNKEKREIER